MRYIPNTEADCHQMLQSIGVSSVEELFADIPFSLRLRRPLKLPPALSEPDLLRHLKEVAAQNAHVDAYSSFLGAGAYNHFVPAAVAHLVFRGEFYTAYTPYQPEISQGTLQAIYEYQTLVCQLTGMEVANASLYEGASATAEAVLMAHRVTERPEVVVSRALHPEYRQVLTTYTRTLGLTLREVPWDETGATDRKALAASLSEKTACVLLQSPNFFGVVEDGEPVAAAAHAVGALVVAVVTEPIALGVLKPPGEWGADVVCGEGQAFGNSLNCGGPYLGLFATRERYLRSMPGRIVGETEDAGGRRGYVLTLSTREQHIRREKATSNICTNEGLCALTATVFAALLGKSGLRELAVTNLQKAAFARACLSRVKGVSIPFSGPTFNECVIRLKRRRPREVLAALLKRKIVGGLDLGRFYPELRDCLLITVTEQNRREEIEALCRALGGSR